ncbi:L-type lectin-domain containing receptor kinase IV.2-like [Castanea sativa]|uniref:L-type lectin-domain containing receptor kinase IV.2-like n=1 Tax=Castanea sativa TaxID=21020 RepID=UPI003F65237A
MRSGSFNSTFVIDIYRKASWNAGGDLTFLIAPDLAIPEGSYGQCLGLTNAANDGKPTNQIMAIEFNNEKQDFGPNDNHISLNINSVNSTMVVSLDDHNIKLSPKIGTIYIVWVHYNGMSKVMEVYMVKEGQHKPEKPLLIETLNLKEYVNKKSSTLVLLLLQATGDPHIELNYVFKWSFEFDDLQKKSGLL